MSVTRVSLVENLIFNAAGIRANNPPKTNPERIMRVNRIPFGSSGNAKAIRLAP